MKKNKIFIIIPIVIIVTLLGVIAYQLARSQFSSSDDTSDTDNIPKSIGNGGQGQGNSSGPAKGVAPGGE